MNRMRMFLLTSARVQSRAIYRDTALVQSFARRPLVATDKQGWIPYLPPGPRLELNFCYAS